MKQLLLGSGDWHWPGWVTVDADPVQRPDIVAAIPPLPEGIKAQRWDTIMAIHTIEHIAPWKAVELCRECRECLADGGTLILEQPNILYAAKVLLGLVEPPDGEPGQYDMWPLYGDPTLRNEWMLHRWGYHPDSMVEMLIAAGFQRDHITVLPAQYHRPVRDFRVEARKA